METRSNSGIQRADYTVDMEHASGFNIRPARIDKSAFCDICGFWKHDVVKEDGKIRCGSCK